MDLQMFNSPELPGFTLQFFSVDPKRILSPKIEFFRSRIGVSDADLPKILAAHSVLLGCSLESTLIPNYNFFESVLHSNELVLKMFKRSPRLFACNVQRTISPNVELLRRIGVPHKFIVYLMRTQPVAVCTSHNKFKRCLDEVIQMGFDPLKLTFVQAVRAFGKMPKSTRDHRMEACRRFGLSDDEILTLFRLRPDFVCYSEMKILKALDFLVNRMKYCTSAVLRCPAALTCDLEKRVIPRYRVIEHLIQKGLVKKDLPLSSFLLQTENVFLNKFVLDYENQLPQLMEIYQGNASFLKSESESGD